MKFQCVGSSWGGLKRWPGTRGIVLNSWIHSRVRGGRKENPPNNTFTARFCHFPKLRLSFPTYNIFIYPVPFQPLPISKLWAFVFLSHKVPLRQEHAEDCHGAVRPGQLPPLQGHRAAVGAGPHVGLRVPGSAQLQRRRPGPSRCCLLSPCQCPWLLLSQTPCHYNSAVSWAIKNNQLWRF